MVSMEGAPARHKAGRCGQKVNCPRGAREAALGRRPLRNRPVTTYHGVGATLVVAPRAAIKAAPTGPGWPARSARTGLRRSPRPGCPDYLFGILQGDKKRKDEKAYREYQSALRRFNYCLKSLAKRLRLNFPVTSYTLRHSWATTAKYRGVPIEMISESLGHKSIKTTQIYLKGFELKERTEVNRMNLSYVKRCGSGLYV